LGLSTGDRIDSQASEAGVHRGHEHGDPRSRGLRPEIEFILNEGTGNYELVPAIHSVTALKGITY